MNAARSLEVLIVTVAVVIASAGSANAQTLFTTDDFRSDRDRWDDPAYYHNNTVFELRDMDRAAVYGEEGTGVVGSMDLASPYTYTSAWEH
ncbi:MAG: hypothetical protein HKN84_13785, partial [Gammaproteobacteria bacterium]|nr:hypothetical protein [Gammaproteobacteria bacterium]